MIWRERDIYVARKNNWRVCAAVAFCVCTNTTAFGKQVVVPGIDLAIDASKLKSIEAPPTQGTNVDTAGVAAGAQAAASTPGYSAGAGAAGSLLGALIVKSLADSSLRKAANKPIEPLREEYAAHWRELGFEATLRDAWNQHALEQQRCTPVAKTKCETRLTLRPEVLMLANGRMFSVSMEAKLQDHKGRTLYTSRLNYVSEPASGSQLEVNDFWSRDDFQSLLQQWTAALQTLVPMLISEVDRREKPSSGTGEAIRYVNAAGIFYDRGVLLSQDDHRVTYRALDGGINVVHIERMLNTDEYYQWLTAPRFASPDAIQGPLEAGPAQ
jgi:hypothetical protein